MSYPQWKRAIEIVKIMKKLDKKGKIIEKNRSSIKNRVKRKYNYCSNSLLLAVYGFYKNGCISNTPRTTGTKFDFKGFDENYSETINNAFNAFYELEDNPTLSALELKSKFGGDLAIYSFVKYFYKKQLLVC